MLLETIVEDVPGGAHAGGNNLAPRSSLTSQKLRSPERSLKQGRKGRGRVTQEYKRKESKNRDRQDKDLMRGDRKHALESKRTRERNDLSRHAPADTSRACPGNAACHRRRASWIAQGHSTLPTSSVERARQESAWAGDSLERAGDGRSG